MLSKGNQPNAAQKRWREAVRELGCLVMGSGPVEIHHPIGCSGRHNKQHIGHLWILPLSKEAHELIGRSRDEFSRKHFGFEFVGPFDLEKTLFADVMSMMGREDFPGTHEELQAIWDYHR